MRSVLMIAALFSIALPLRAAEKKLNANEIDKQLIDVLKDIHNQGADLYNAGDAAGCYRLFEGSLRTARAMLAHRPAEQKFIDDVLANAAKQAAPQRAFALHESIEKLRDRLKTATTDLSDKKKPEALTVPPRERGQQKKQPLDKQPLPNKTEPKQVKKEQPKPPFPPKDGVMGRLYWQGKPVSGAEIAFVSRGAINIRVFEAKSDNDGFYKFGGVPPGKYTVLLTMPGSQKLVFPERYATTTTSPLIVDVKGGGDTLDLLLQ